MSESVILDLSNRFDALPENLDAGNYDDDGWAVAELYGRIKAAFGDEYEYIPDGRLSTLLEDAGRIPQGVVLDEDTREGLGSSSSGQEMINAYQRFIESDRDDLIRSLTGSGRLKRVNPQPTKG